MAAPNKDETETKKKRRRKSAAQVRRMQRRAAARGTEYEPPPPPTPPAPAVGDVEERGDGDENEERRRETIVAAARRLRRALSDVEGDASLNAKARRSARRRAEAVASEEVGGTMTASELLAMLERTDEDAAEGGGDVANDTVKEADASKTRGGKKRKRKNGGSSGDDGEDEDEGGGKNAGDDRGGKQKGSGNPYVLFVGQLAYSTTADDLRGHFREVLGDAASSPSAMKIRLLTTRAKKSKADTTGNDEGRRSGEEEEKPATKREGCGRSRGMAFVELSSPESMHECLKLHHTTLQGRRINVERSAGGGRSSDRRKAKIKEYRDAQTKHMSETVDAILAEYVAGGDLVEGELDEGVVALCKRSHTASSVREALAAYVEEKAANGEKDNPSAYVTHLLGRAATEGLGGRREDEVRSRKGRSRRPGRQTSAKKERGEIERERENDMEDDDAGSGDGDGGVREESSFVIDRRGEKKRDNDVGQTEATMSTDSDDRAHGSEIDMSISEREEAEALESSSPDYSRIFPSLSGRGRGARRGGVGRA